MHIIMHRVETLEQLAQVRPEWGVEIDIRDYDGDLRLTHDPFRGGLTLDALLAAYRHGTLIFNVKCDGLEGRVMEAAARHNVTNYFFLDLANPTLIRLARGGERRLAVRFSEYEPIEACLPFAGMADWVWIDCFTRLPLDPDSYARLKKHFRLCLVSPELQKHPASAIADYRKALKTMPLDAVCTDLPDAWL